MSLDRAYFTVLVLTHLGFAAVFLFLHLHRRSRFLGGFAAAWLVEAARIVVHLIESEGHALHDRLFALQDLGYLAVTWLLLYSSADLVGARLRRGWAAVYVGLSVPLILANYFLLRPDFVRAAGWDRQPGIAEAVFLNMLVVFVPGGVARLAITGWYFLYWRKSGMPGALIAAVFFLLHACGSLSVPLQWYFSYYPPDGYLTWFFEVLGLSVGVLMLALNRQQAERDRLYEEARAANRLKDEFLATLSHELRTPLNAIVGWAHLLRSGSLDPQTTDRAIQTIQRNAEAQAQLIADILDVSRIVTGKMQIEQARVELGGVLAQAVEAVKPAAEAKGIRLELSLDPKAAPVTGDAARLQQVFWNLLSNAVKFTPREGRVGVALRGNGREVAVTVADDGIGIAPDFLPHLFERFRQADASVTRAYGGLGLGLAIVRHLAELHGGTVEAASDGPGRGARFTVTLPAAPADQRPALAPPTAAESAGAALEGLRVLVVDDQPDAREIAALALERAGARVTTSASSREGLEALDRTDPQVLLIDIGMPDEDGYTLLSRIRARAAGHTPPAVALTAYAAPADVSRAIAAGFQVHMAKPVEPDRLVAEVARLAGRSASA